MRTKASTGKIRQIYEFIKANQNRFDVRKMCRVRELVLDAVLMAVRRRRTAQNCHSF